MQPSPPSLFSYPHLLRAHARARAANVATSISENPLWQMACERLCERLCETTRSFEHTLVFAPWENNLADYARGTGRTRQLYTYTLQQTFGSTHDTLTLEENSYDAVISCLSISAINDIPGVLAQLYSALKPDGLLLINLLGGHSLHELRASFAATETEIIGGLHPHVHPFMDVRDAGALLQRAGFNLPVIDRDMMRITYEHAFALMHELRALGASNTLTSRRKLFTRREVMMQMAHHYAEQFASDDGGVACSLELLTLVAWKPHASQPKPLARGSATFSLKDALKD